MSGTVPPSGSTEPHANGASRRRPPQQPVPPAVRPRPSRHLGLFRGRRSQAPPAPLRLVVDLTEIKTGQRAGWTAGIHAPGFPHLALRAADTLHIGSHPDLASLLRELERILGLLRHWWPDLDVRFTLNASAAAALRAARLNGLTLPR